MGNTQRNIPTSSSVNFSIYKRLQYEKWLLLSVFAQEHMHDVEAWIKKTKLDLPLYGNTPPFIYGRADR